MTTEVKEHEEGKHSARYLILIFLVLVAMCGVFFSAGFIVGRNERSLHTPPPTEVVTTPGVVPPTVNPPPDNALPDSAGSQPAPNSAPQSEVIPPEGAGTNRGPAMGKPAETPPAPEQAAPKADKPEAPPSNAELAKGITLQVLAMHTRPDAESVVTVLKDKGYPVFLLTPENAHADDSLYRVVVGPFKTRDEADKARDRLKNEGFKPFIRH